MSYKGVNEGHSLWRLFPPGRKQGWCRAYTWWTKAPVDINGRAIRVEGVNARGLSKRKWQDLMVWWMTTIGGHKRVNLNKIITFQEEMTKRRMVPLLGSRLLQRWWRDWGCGHGAGARKWGGSCLLLNFLIYFLLPGFYSPHISSVPPYLSDGIPVSSYLGVFFPFHTNLYRVCLSTKVLK